MATITAKVLASELDMTPKKLRRKLRALAADGQLDHSKGNRWEFDAETVAQVKEALAKASEPEETEDADVETEVEA